MLLTLDRPVIHDESVRTFVTTKGNKGSIFGEALAPLMTSAVLGHILSFRVYIVPILILVTLCVLCLPKPAVT